MKKAFTLIELVIVITIIGILVATLAASFGGSKEKAEAVKCATNIRNLAMAAISAGFPPAYSGTRMLTEMGRGSVGVCYTCNNDDPVFKYRGWVSWLDQGTGYPIDSPSEFQECSLACTNEEESRYALTNGAVWCALGGRHESYLCPAFVKACRKKGVRNPLWSYRMNAYFYPGRDTSRDDDMTKVRADKLLLFAEIPALELKPSEAKKGGITSLPEVELDGGNGSQALDGCLHDNESIGFNHFRSNQYIGHVAFADGHVETIIAPKNGNFLELTEWLCKAKDIVYHDGNYEDIDDTGLK